MGELVSILTTVRNGERWMPGFLDSVLGQTHSDLEVVICDNGSVDRTEDIVKARAALDPRVRYSRNPSDLGIVRSLDRAYELSIGSFAKMVMVDDRIAPTCIERLLQPLLDEPQLVFSYSARSLIDDDDRVKDPWREFAPMLDADGAIDGVAVGDLVLTTCLNWVGEPLFRRSSIEPGDLFSLHGRKYSGAEDVVFNMKLLAQGAVWHIVEPLSSFRNHNSQEGATWQRQFDTTLSWVYLFRDGKRNGFLSNPIDELQANASFLARAVNLYVGGLPQMSPDVRKDPSVAPRVAKLAESIAVGASTIATLEASMLPKS